MSDHGGQHRVAQLEERCAGIPKVVGPIPDSRGCQVYFSACPVSSEIYDPCEIPDHA